MSESDVETATDVDSLIEEVLMIGPDEYDDDTKLEDLDVDSLLIVELAEVINMELDVEIPNDALDEEINDFGDLKTYIAENRE